MTPDNLDFWFLPLGGTGEIGMNMNLYGHDGQWLMVDCGVTFEKNITTDEIANHSVQIQMADPQFIIDNQQLLAGIIITHAHEDHIGAVPYLWKKLRCPIYTTAFTAEILRRKLIEVGLEKKVSIVVVEKGQQIDIGVFHVEWVALTHSIPEPYALIISTDVGRVFHTGDWKLDKTPIIGEQYDERRYKALANESIDVMVCDSTNATEQGWSLSEADLHQGLEHHISKATGRVIVTCFGSNIARIHTLAKIAEKTGRHFGLLGRSLINNMSAARKLGLWTSTATNVEPQHLGYLPPKTVLLVVTGSQGEPRTVLHRLSLNSFRDMALEAGDTVIFSSKVIPGNEVDIEAVITRLKAMQVIVIVDGSSDYPIHASGHPAVEELKIMYRCIQPDCMIPVHGEKQHLLANAAVAKSEGISKQIIGQNGDLFFIAPIKGIRRNATKVGRWGIKKATS